MSVTFNLQTPQEATGLVELLVRKLKGGELHLRDRHVSVTCDLHSRGEAVYEAGKMGLI